MKKTLTIDIAKRIEAYRHLFPDLTDSAIRPLLKSGILENMIIDMFPVRPEKMPGFDVFKRHLKGVSYPLLAKEFKCSLRAVTKAINTSRASLISQINEARENGLLTQIEAPKKKNKKSTLKDWKLFTGEENNRPNPSPLSTWEDHKKELFNS